MQFTTQYKDKGLQVENKKDNKNKQRVTTKHSDGD